MSHLSVLWWTITQLSRNQFLTLKYELKSMCWVHGHFQFVLFSFMKFHILRIESVKKKKKKEQQPKSNKIYEGIYTPLPGQGQNLTFMWGLCLLIEGFQKQTGRCISYLDSLHFHFSVTWLELWVALMCTCALKSASCWKSLILFSWVLYALHSGVPKWMSLALHSLPSN